VDFRAKTKKPRRGNGRGFWKLKPLRGYRSSLIRYRSSPLRGSGGSGG